MKKQALLIPLSTVAMLLSCGGKHVIDYKVNQKEFEAAFNKEFAQVDVRGHLTTSQGDEALKFMTYRYSPTAYLLDYDVVYNDSPSNENTCERYQTYISKNGTKVHKEERSYDFATKQWGEWSDTVVQDIPRFVDGSWNIQKTYEITDFGKAFFYREEGHYYFGEALPSIPGGQLIFLYFEDKQLVNEEFYGFELIEDFDVQTVRFTYKQETPTKPE